MKSDTTKKKLGLWSTIGGAISAALGVLGAMCTLAVCPCVAIAVLTAIFGVGIAAFLSRYSWAFIILGALLVANGIWQFKRRKKAACPFCAEVPDEDNEG